MIEIANILDVEKYLDGIKAAIFDLDDTLYSEKDYVKSGYKAIAQEFPQIENMADKLWSVFEQGGKAIDVVLSSEGGLTDEMKAKCLEIYRFHKPNINLYPGVKEMLQRLKSYGIKLGMITDGRPEGQHAKIDALGIKTLFDEIVITDELGGIAYRKPNSCSFKIMQAKLEVTFNQMLYVGDNIQKDFIVPENLGMLPIFFKNRLGLYCKF